MKRAVLVASFTVDVIRIGDKVYEKIGGPAYYSGLTLKMLGLDPIVITALGSYGRKKVGELLSIGSGSWDLEIVDTDPHCSSIYTFHHTYTKTGRSSEILKIGCTIRVDRVLNSIGEDLRWIIASPVFKEIEQKDIAKLSPAKNVALDLQGYAREVEDHKVISNLNNIERNVKELPRVRIVHLSSDDIHGSSGEDSRDLERLSFLASKADIILYTIGIRGSYLGLATNNKEEAGTVTWHYIPPYTETDGGDPTGCGDIFLASMVSNMIMNRSTIDAAIRASIISGIRVSRGFPIEISPTEIENIARFLEGKAHMISFNHINLS